MSLNKPLNTTLISVYSSVARLRCPQCLDETQAAVHAFNCQMFLYAITSVVAGTCTPAEHTAQRSLRVKMYLHKPAADTL